MIYLVFALNFLLMIAMPILLARFIAARRGVSWTLFGMGAVTFVVSQIGHIPFNGLILQRWQLVPTDTAVFTNLLIYALFLGLSAGIFEEGARYLTYRFWAKDARSWGKGLMLGAGHGGIEAILLGLTGIINVGALVLIRQGMFVDAIPPDQMPLVQEQITAVFSTPLPAIMLGAMERLFALCAHLAMSLLVMQVFVRGQLRWLLASILWHTLLNASAVIAVTTWNAYVTEAIIGLFALLSIGIIFWLRTPEPVEPKLEPLPEMKPLAAVGLETTAETLERSKFT
jgi:uncharacterized membrane protein YhfC